MDDEVVSPAYCDIAIAVQTDKGLMVPVIRNAEVLGLAEIEKRIADLAERARKARLSIEEMTGGTFTISNGGIYGSMLSTPILNPPQSGILGMHNIIERPVAIDGQGGSQADDVHCTQLRPQGDRWKGFGGLSENSERIHRGALTNALRIGISRTTSAGNLTDSYRYW